MPINGYFDIPFAENGDLNTIPDPTQPSGTVSYNQGFPIGYSTPVASGGLLVPRTAFNQVLFDVTSAVQYLQQNGVPRFITSAMNGGSPFSYAKYSVVRDFATGIVYQSLADANTDVPPSVNWKVFDFRIKLAANANYYVATTGNDTTGDGSNALPWATIQHAVNYVAQNLDLNGFVVQINVADGTYTGAVAIGTPFVGGNANSVSIHGNTTTPANVIISTTSANCISAAYGCQINVAGMKFQTNTTGHCLAAVGAGAAINVNGPVEFGAVAATYSHLLAQQAGNVNITANYKISAGAASHYSINNGGNILVTSGTITITGTPAFTSFALVSTGLIAINSGFTTFSGAATGQRYVANANGVINTSGSGGTFLPGNSAGATATGGQYL